MFQKLILSDEDRVLLSKSQPEDTVRKGLLDLHVMD